MIDHFPKYFSSKAIGLYLAALCTVSLLFNRYAMSADFIIMGLVWVFMFFLATPSCSLKWRNIGRSEYCKNIFFVALALRVIWVLFSYFYYTAKTGQPFEFGVCDAKGYHEEASWFIRNSKSWADVFKYYSDFSGVSDTGVIFYYVFLYKIFGPNILLTRLIGTLWSSWLCVLLYKLSARTFGEQTGRMAGVFAVFMPNLIFYCGLHLKENFMLFLVVAAMERSDYALRKPKLKVWDVLAAMLLAFSLFLFRTVLGVAMIIAILTSIVFSPGKLVGGVKKSAIAFWAVLVILFLGAGKVSMEVEHYWENRDRNWEMNREQKGMRGSQWAKYATAPVMAPMIFVLPFPTMTNVNEQYTQQMLHGGNFVRNFMGIFVLIALWFAIFVDRDWRQYLLIGAYTISYLGIIAMSGFNNSERFLLPALPGLIMIWARGVSKVTPNVMWTFKWWYVLVVLMSVGWAYFKLGNKGLL